MNETEFEFIEVPDPPSRWPIFWALLVWIVISAAAWWIAFTFKPHIEHLIKVAHVVVFFVWSLATFNLLRRQSVWGLGYWGQLSVCLLAAVTTELAQHWMPGHHPDWVGFGCSSLGVALAGFVWWRIDASARRRIQEQLDYDAQEQQDLESASDDGNDFDACAEPPAEWWPPTPHRPNGENPAPDPTAGSTAPERFEE